MWKIEFLICPLNSKRYFAGMEEDKPVFSHLDHPLGNTLIQRFTTYGEAETLLMTLDIRKGARLTIEKHFVKI